MSDQRGITVVELLVAVVAGLAVLMASFTMLNATLRGNARVGQRVDANQRGRPVLTRIMDELHSVCVAPGLPPVLSGSTDTSITFLHKTGSAVEPAPDRRTISLTSGTLSESVYPYVSGSAPNYTFSSTPTTTRLLTRVGNGRINGASVPPFRYYAYSGNVVSTTPLPTPLTEADAARTVQVTVTFAVSPGRTRVVESTAAATLTDTALFRFTPAAEDASSTNPPCV